jgi:hypothetical protein
MDAVELNDKIRKWKLFHDREAPLLLVPPAPGQSEEAFLEETRTIAGKLGYTVDIRKEGDEYVMYRL